jgi:hypothetical protein
MVKAASDIALHPMRVLLQGQTWAGSLPQQLLTLSVSWQPATGRGASGFLQKQLQPPPLQQHAYKKP